MLKRFVLLFAILLLSSAVSAQDTPTPTATATETPAPTVTPTPDISVYVTVQPGATGTPGQSTRFDYTITAGERYIGDMLTWLLYSVWGFFLFGVIVIFLRYRRR